MTGIDHLIIAVADLGEGEAAMEKAGFLPTPRGLHSAEMGTANATIVLGDRTYFEVLGIVAPTEANVAIRAGIDAGRALFGLALTTEDARATQDDWDAAGVGTGEMRAFSRPVDLPGGTREAAFRTAYVSADACPGAYSFACEHLTPDVVWREDYLVQPNAVVGLRKIVAVADDPAAAAAAWARIPGLSATDGTVAMDGRALEFVTPAAFTAATGATPPAVPAMTALVFASSDLGRTRAALEAGGYSVAEEGAGLRTTILGITFRFEPA